MALRKLQLLQRLNNGYIIAHGCRTYLSEAYGCDETWNRRLQHPLIQKIKPAEFAFELDRKYKKENRISPIDVDLFLNSLTPKDAHNLADDVELCLHRLRRSPDTIHTLASTAHATVRALLVGDNTDMLLRLLSDPLRYGLFPDHYTCNLMMDAFVKQKNYTAAARVAAYLMLQEDFGPALSQALALAACHHYVTAENNEEWVDYEVKPEEPVEEVKVRVAYLRNPYNDDHFDLKDPNHIVGKTLASLAPLMASKPLLATYCEALGWALFSKWGNLQGCLERTVKGTENLDAGTAERIKTLVSSAEGDDDIREEVLSLLSRLEATGRVKQMDLRSLVDEEVAKARAACEDAGIKEQISVLGMWEKKREEELENQLKEFEKEWLLEEIEAKKKDLATKEEVIFFFDNKDKLVMLLPEKKRRYYPKRKSLIYGKKQPRKVEEGYVPPEISKGFTQRS
ncbi:uncharacterized protein LOC143031130 [Oratosquilla oratoria]|uniref:uncharacterized protein LOC143031130 n=1 Tax=Oratosquilla oratoria TaxID=337810 RepID=UPI003F75DAB5